MTDTFAWLREQSVQGIITGAQMEQFCKEQRDILLNLPVGTLGGAHFWESIEIDGWRLQRHKLTRHCRILDPKKVRRAWGTETQILTMFCRYLQEQQQIARVAEKRYGIVFSGGGGRGAYQIGVWKYLWELGLDRQITGISGASVGALNSLLFAQGDWHLAQSLWLRMEQKDMTPLELLRPSSGWFSMDKLDEAIQRAPLDWSRILGPGRLIYTVLSRSSWFHAPGTAVKEVGDLWLPFCQAEYRCWTGLDPKDVREIVLASAALPVVYGERQAAGRIYLDGGIQDNVPVRPLVEAGYREILVIHLLRKANQRAETEWRRAVKNLDCSGTVFHHVYPGEDFDDSWQTALTIDPERTKANIALGYRDARAQLSALGTRSQRSRTAAVLR